jgi:hypothetical protein
MKIYKIIVTRYSKPWCEILIDNGTRSDEILLDSFTNRFPKSEGFKLTYLKANGEKRLLESSPEGIKVISRQPIFISHEL